MSPQTVEMTRRRSFMRHLPRRRKLMAITITFDDYQERTFESATKAEQVEPRGPYHLRDEEGALVALVPDFGVRLVAINN
jgi:hypothetical protein